jgi:hypothetical protein
MTSTLSRVLIGCLILLAFVAGASWGATQFGGGQPVIPPTVYSGSEIGFRMTARKGDTPIGRLVVRVDGEWKEVEFPFGVRPLSH